jgi:hypothetical protein
MRTFILYGALMTIERDQSGFDAPVPLGHPARAELPTGHSTGPEIGEYLPDFELPDANGRRVRLHQDRAGAKIVLVFFRSAIW